MPTDPSGTAQELAGLVTQVQPRIVVTDAAMHDVMSASGIADAATLLDIDVLLGDWRLPDTTVAAGPSVTVTPDDLAVLIPTSGTTGKSKLVMQTHRAYAMAGAHDGLRDIAQATIGSNADHAVAAYLRDAWPAPV